jgi:hypothetical protein
MKMRIAGYSGLSVGLATVFPHLFGQIVGIALCFALSGALGIYAVAYNLARVLS